MLDDPKLTDNTKKSLYFKLRIHEEMGHLITGLWGCID